MRTLNFLTHRWQRSDEDSPFFLSVTFDRNPVDKYLLEFFLDRTNGSNWLRRPGIPTLEWTALTGWRISGESNYRTIPLGPRTTNANMYAFTEELRRLRRERTKNRPKQPKLPGLRSRDFQ